MTKVKTIYETSSRCPFFLLRRGSVDGFEWSKIKSEDECRGKERKHTPTEKKRERERERERTLPPTD